VLATVDENACLISLDATLPWATFPCSIPYFPISRKIHISSTIRRSVGCSPTKNERHRHIRGRRESSANPKDAAGLEDARGQIEGLFLSISAEGAGFAVIERKSRHRLHRPKYESACRPAAPISGPAQRVWETNPDSNRIGNDSVLEGCNRFKGGSGNVARLRGSA